MKTYRAFVASTFEDLALHRKHVISALRNVGLEVEAMEEFSASSDPPRDVCAARMRRCNVCVLLVAYRCGARPRSEALSFSQIEYEIARAQGIELFVFLLSESPKTAAGWNTAFDDRQKDATIREWREQLRENHHVREFDVDPHSIPIDAAIAQWVVKVESERGRIFRKRILAMAYMALAFVLAFVCYGIYAAQSPQHRHHYLSYFLGRHDPAIFNHSSDGNYEVARAVGDSAALGAQTNLSEEIKGTHKQFDMLVNNAQYIRYQQEDNLRDIIRKGGRVRIILWDYRETNRPSYDAFCWAIGQNPEETREGAKNVESELKKWEADISQDRQTYPGSFEFRWNKKPLFYTMWVRDWGSPDSIGHLSVHFYRGQKYFVNFRVSARDSAQTLENMHEEFEKAWADAEVRHGD